MNIKAEYKKDLSSNYLVLEMTEEKIETFALKMLSQNCVDGLLGLEVKMIDERKYIYYNITGMKTLKEFVENTPVGFDSLKRIYNNIFRLPEFLQEYLIDESSILLIPEFIYMDQNLERIECCYYPEIDLTLREQVAELTEYLMNRVDYKDEQAVLSIYALYQMSHESSCTLERLKEVFEDSNRRDKKELPENTVNKKDEKELSNNTVNEKDKQEIFEHVHKGDKRDNIYQEQQEWKEKQKWTGKQNGQEEKNRQNRQKKRNGQEKEKGSQKENFNSQIRKLTPSDDIFYTSPQRMGKENKIEKANGQINRQIDRQAAKKETEGENLSNPQKEKKTQDKRKSRIDYPHMEERVESQKEIMRYPLSIYVSAAASLVSGAAVLMILWRMGFLSPAGILDIKRCSVAAFIYVFLEILVLLYLFRKENLCAVIKDTVDYMDWEEYEYEYDSEPIQGMEDFIQAQPVRNYYQDAFLKETSNEWKKTELLSKEDGEEELKTELLVDYREQKTAYLESEITGERIYLKQFPFILGKLKQGVDYVLNNNKISRIHARFLYDAGVYYVEDMDSTNGTNVNGSALSPHERKAVQDQDAISFADKNYVFHC